MKRGKMFPNDFEGVAPDDVLILCDFDGTVSSVDMGNEVVKRFTDGRSKEIDRAYCAGEIGSRNAYSQLNPLFKGTKTEILHFVRNHEKIDPYFPEFYAWCREQGFDLKIVSDGLDLYIEALLSKHKLEEIEYFSNVVSFPDHNLFIEFPQMNKDCEKCGTCKSNILKKHRQNYKKIIYIGDSYSDFCPAKEADMVFAKGILHEKCVEKGWACEYYETFRDVHDYLASRQRNGKDK
jgi:2-hydroxy-3-keto-5-methylthiopentenyl-1-phosphate phosphatase